MTPDSIAELLKPYVGTGAETSAATSFDWPRIYSQLSIYLELILKWNARINLTAIREPEEIVRRHFGESLFAGIHLGDCGTLLDFGSGAGFPGIPIQLLRPDLNVTLAESRGKKATFLREVTRSLALATEVWGGRVEAMPADRRFDTVTLRAVDKMGMALREASQRTDRMLVLGSRATIPAYPGLSEEFAVTAEWTVPETTDGLLLDLRRR